MGEWFDEYLKVLSIYQKLFNEHEVKWSYEKEEMLCEMWKCYVKDSETIEYVKN